MRGLILSYHSDIEFDLFHCVVCLCLIVGGKFFSTQISGLSVKYSSYLLFCFEVCHVHVEQGSTSTIH